MTTTAPDPIAIIKSKNYAALLVIAAIIGIPVAIFAYFFLYIITKLQQFIYTDIPTHFSSVTAQRWWPVIPLTIAGLLVGLIVTKMPGKGGEEPIEGFKPGGATTQSKVLWGIGLASVISIGLGAVIGPEAPLVALGGGVAYTIVQALKRRQKLEPQATALIATSGSFAAISTLLGSPLTGAFLLMEAAGLGGLMMEVALLPGLLAAGIGYLLFVGLDSLTGLGIVSLTIPNLPYYSGPTLAEFVWAIIIALCAPFLVYSIRRVGFSYKKNLTKNTILYTMFAGLIIGILVALFATITKESGSYILFSGQDQLPLLINGAATFSISALVLMFICKAIAYGVSLVSFRGGPTFPAMFLGAIIGVIVASITGLPVIATVSVGIGAMTASVLRLPLTAVLLTTMFLGSDGLKTMPLTIVAVVIAYVATTRLNAKS